MNFKFVKEIGNTYIKFEKNLYLSAPSMCGSAAPEKYLIFPSEPGPDVEFSPETGRFAGHVKKPGPEKVENTEILKCTSLKDTSMYKKRESFYNDSVP